MMTRRRYKARTSAAIDGLVTRLELKPGERAGLRTRMARYNRDCGCTMGGAFTAIALLAFAAYLIVTARFTIGVLGVGIAFVIVSSALGKALGLLVASARLGLLRRSLARRVRHMKEISYVHVH